VTIIRRQVFQVLRAVTVPTPENEDSEVVEEGRGLRGPAIESLGKEPGPNGSGIRKRWEAF